jgi:hypothetical protein
MLVQSIASEWGSLINMNVDQRWKEMIFINEEGKENENPPCCPIKSSCPRHEILNFYCGVLH